MIGLDVGQFVPEIARHLLLRSGDLPPLIWCREPHCGAKKILDELNDARLFAPVAPAREDMAATVRSLLYFWHGWPGECLLYGQVAPEPQRSYLTALCERQAQRYAESKAAFKQIQEHPIFQPLMVYALSIIPLTVDPPLQRICEMLRMEHHWEPFLFTDAWIAGAAGQLRPAGETIVRQVQCREFELLLAYVYEQATGQTVTHRRGTDSAEDAARRARARERRMKEERRRREKGFRRQQTAAAHEKAKESPSVSAAAGPRTPAGLRIRCPKCNSILTVPLASRGKATRCGHCSTGFMVPGGIEPLKDVIGIICPKCHKRLTFEASARGRKAQCMHCAGVFVVPQASSPAAPKS